MTDPTEMVPWLNACYDRAEQRARAVTEHQPLDEWTAIGARGDTDIDNSYWSVVKVARPDPTPAAKAIAEHIADLDPSWRLADIGRKRKILDMHEIEWGLSEYAQSWGKGEGKPFGCAVCHTHDGIIVGDGYCTTARLLAEEFAGEPGYQESWRP